MEENQDTMTNPTVPQSPSPLPVVETPIAPPPAEVPNVGKKSNTGLLLLLGVVVIALLILGGVTFLALQSGTKETTETSPQPTPTLTVTPTPANDETSEIKKDLDQTTV